MRVLLSTYGSRGDVQPLAALALALRAQGAEAVVSTPADPEYVALLHDVMVPMAPAFMPVGEWIAWAKASGLKVPGFAARMVPEQFAAIRVAADGCDVIVGTGLFPSVAAAQAVAETMNLPFVHVAFCPLYLPSSAHPPVARPGWPHPEGLRDNAALWRHNDVAMDALFGEAVNALRTSKGLSAAQPVQGHVFTAYPWLASDPVLGPWPGGGLVEVVQTGAWLMPDARPLPPQLEGFLQGGPAPVFVGFGSMPMQRAPDAGRFAIEVARAAGRRIILSRGLAGWAAIDGGDDCLLIGEVNQQALFPRVAVVVHHGGAGTTATAARAGVPQVIVPQLIDQPYWARRVADLGIGVAHDGAAPTQGSLSAALAAALRPAMQDQAKVVSVRIKNDGAEEAARQLMAMNGQGSTSRDG
jgi:vancomycin aglycone glucosyltransferase